MNGLSAARCQATILNNDDVFSIRPSRSKCSEMMKIYTKKKTNWKLPSSKSPAKSLLLKRLFSVGTEKIYRFLNIKFFYGWPADSPRKRSWISTDRCQWCKNLNRITKLSWGNVKYGPLSTLYPNARYHCNSIIESPPLFFFTLQSSVILWIDQCSHKICRSIMWYMSSNKHLILTDKIYLRGIRLIMSKLDLRHIVIL